MRSKEHEQEEDGEEEDEGEGKEEEEEEEEGSALRKPGLHGSQLIQLRTFQVSCVLDFCFGCENSSIVLQKLSSKLSFLIKGRGHYETVVPTCRVPKKPVHRVPMKSLFEGRSANKSALKRFAF